MVAVLVVALLGSGIATVLVRQLSDEVDRALSSATGGTTSTAPPGTTEPGGSEPGEGTDTTRQGGSTPEIVGPAPAQQAELRELGAQVAEIRGLSWRQPLQVKLGTKAELSVRLRELVAEEMDRTAERLAGDEASLKMLKLIPADLDYRKTIDDLLAGSVLGFYDDETKELFVGTPDSGELDPATRETMAHEMTHALTDQNFEFGVKTKALDDAGRTEELGGWAALIEGDAEALRSVWSEKHLTRAERLEAALGNSGTGSPGAVPRYIRDALVFPYTDGTAFVGGLLERGGFAAVDRAYQAPPTSTEQIFHPNLYARGQGWTEPPLPDLPSATGCQKVDSGTLGEFDMRHLLYSSMSRANAERAAAGWNGDLFTMVSCDGKRGLADRWRTDPGVDPGRLAEALKAWSREWSGGSGPDSEGRFSGPSGAGRISTSGDRLDLVVADDEATADRLWTALAAG